MKKQIIECGKIQKQIMPKYNAYQSGYGTIPSEKDKLKNRNSKQSQREKYRTQMEYLGKD